MLQYFRIVSRCFILLHIAYIIQKRCMLNYYKLCQFRITNAFLQLVKKPDPLHFGITHENMTNKYFFRTKNHLVLTG